MSLTNREQQEITRANDSGRVPVVFVHGLWLLPSSWQPWRDLFEENGFTTLAPGWPDDPETVEEARANPSVFAGKKVGAVVAHFLEAIAALQVKPAVVGHSFGGAFAQILAGRGVSRASVSIDPAPVRGVLPLPISTLRSAFPVLGNPLNATRAVTLTFEQYRYGWTNAVDEAEARSLYEATHVAAPGAPLFEGATANVNPFSALKADARNPDRGPLLFVSGGADHTVPHAITNASYKRQAKNPGVTEIVEVEGRGHSLTIDSGWRDVADPALAFVQRFS
ncbi:alpha/beta hydrolase [Spongisporangium articulatum]|uniref:Alpha/beta hydrolase n=1 Tax=Spongisporangium articulatum TaxID=3362603 RepID=A0ABW8AIK2_9ACTN